MEPVTALGVAGSVIQIVDFSVRFLSQVKNICDSTDGEIEEFTNLRRDATRLRKLNTSIAAALKAREGETVLTDLERDTLAICIECEATSVELLSSLKEVDGKGEGHGRPLAATLIAVKAIWKKKKSTKLQGRLESLRGMLVGSIVANM
jgi:hypothetical protein